MTQTLLMVGMLFLVASVFALRDSKVWASKMTYWLGIGLGAVGVILFLLAILLFAGII